TYRDGPTRTQNGQDHWTNVNDPQKVKKDLVCVHPRKSAEKTLTHCIIRAMTKTLLSILLLCLSLDNVAAQQSADDYNTIFTPLKWRLIGPFRGGRSVAGCGVVGDPKTYYMGTTGCGLWKTEDMGISWRNVSDGFFKTGSVDAVAVAENDPNVVYIGMGEHAVRGVMTHHGDGVYKS